MAIGPSMIEQLEDLRSLSTGQLKGMLGTPSPHASPVFIAMVLKEREDAEKRYAGREAAAQTAQQAPTVAHRLAGQQQPMPMSQAGAMAAPPQQPPMPKEAQLAMALSGATGQPPPQLPTVNMQRGTSGAAMREMAKALRKEGTRTYAQKKAHQPFSSRERPSPVYNEGGLGALITAIVRAQSEKSKAYGGFDISEDIRLPRGRGRTVAAARPVAMAEGGTGSGTTGDIIQSVAEGGWNTPMAILARWLAKRSRSKPREDQLPVRKKAAGGMAGGILSNSLPTTYAQDGFRFSPEQVLDVERTGVPPWVQQEVLRRQQDWAERPGLGVGAEDAALSAEPVPAQRAATEAAPETMENAAAVTPASPLPLPTSAEFSGSEAIGDEVYGAGLGWRRTVLSGPPRQPLIQESRTLIPIPAAASAPGASDPAGPAPNPVAEQSVPRVAGRTGRGKGAPKTRVGEVIENLLARPDSKRGIAAIASERAALAAALKPYEGFNDPAIGEPVVDEVIPISVGAPVTKEAAAEVEVAKAPPIPKLVVNDPKKLKMAVAPRVTVDTAGAQVATSPVDGEIVDVRDIYKTSLDQLSAGTREAYEDMDAKLKEVSKLNKADFNKLGESFKALEDFYKTGKLPERMRESRITNLLLELAKGFLGKPTMHEALEAGIAGFQAVDAKDRKQYAEGLSAMLTANQALLSAKVTMRNGELKERQALLRGRRQESLGNVQLATEQMKVASQENERVRTAAYRIEMAGIARINANANLLNAQTTTLQKNIKGVADADLTRLRAALERGKNDPAYRATPEYRAATEELGRKFIVGEDGTAHPDFLVYGKIVQDMTRVPSAYQAEATQSRFDSQKVAFITRIDRALAPLLEGRANTDRELWKAIAASAKIPLPKDGKIGSQWFTDNNAALRKAARLYIGGQMAGQVGYTGRMEQWLKDRGYLGQQGGAAQGRRPTRSLEELTTPKTKSE